MNVLNRAGSGTWLVQRHHDAVAQAAAGMAGTRVGRVGEPDILAATSGWQQGPSGHRATAPRKCPAKTPRTGGAFNVGTVKRVLTSRGSFARIQDDAKFRCMGRMGCVGINNESSSAPAAAA